MQVRARRTAGRAHQTDGLARLDVVADGYEVLLVVRIPGHIAIAVIDLDHLAVTVAFARPCHDACTDRDNLAAGLTGKVDAAMVGVLASERIGAPPEGTRHPARLHRAPLRIDALV